MANGALRDDTELALDEAHHAIRGLLVRAARDNARTRYEIGALLRKVKTAREEYGEHAVERLAARLEIAAATLYRYASVADNWTAAEVAALTECADGAGSPLCWSHLVVLTKATAATSRRQLAKRCRAESWSVRELERQVDAGRDPLALRRPHSEEDPIEAALVERLHSASRATVQVGVFVDALHSRLADGEADADLVTRAIAAYEALLDKVDTTLRCLRQTVRAPVAPGSGPVASPRATGNADASMTGKKARAAGAP